MLHLTGIKYFTDEKTEAVQPVDDESNVVMAALHSELAYMYAADTLKGVIILVVDDALNVVRREPAFKTVGAEDKMDLQLAGIQYAIEGKNIPIPTAGYTSLNAANARYHQEMASMYASDTLRGCGIKIYNETLDDILNETEYRDVEP